MHSRFHPFSDRSRWGRALWLVALAAALGLAWLAPLEARAQTGVPGNPNEFVTISKTDSLAFAAPTTQVATLNAFVTTVIGKLNGGTVYDQVFDLPAASFSVQTALTAANAVIFADSGPGVIIDAPILSSSTAQTMASTSTYSLDPVQPAATITLTINFGPGPVPFGDQRSCGAAIAALPSTTEPVCATPPAATVFMLPVAQEDDNVATGTIYLIDTATLNTTTNTLRDVYEIDGFYGAVSAVPEPSAWGLMLAGVAVMGAALRLGRRKRTELARSPSKPSRQKGRGVVMALVLATAGLAPLAAGAQTAAPGSHNEFTSTSATDSLMFAAPTTQVATINNFVTTVIGKLNGGTVYDQVFDLASASSSVQTALATANAVIFADGGPGVIIDAPSLASSTGSSMASTSTYSLDPVQPTATITVTTNFGPELFTLGDQRSCGAAVSALPSTTEPVCATPPTGTLFNLLAGQVDTNVNTATIYLIDTATLNTTTNTLTDVYEIDGFYSAVSAVPEPSAWGLMLAGVAVVGAALRLGRGKRAELARSPSKPSPQKGRAVVMALALATAGLAPLAARAQTPIPGALNHFTSTSAGDSLAFAPPTTQVATTNDFVTTVIGKLNGGTVYDQVFDLASASSSVQTALATANATIFADSGPGVIIDAPILTSSTISTMASISTYSLDPMQPVKTITLTTNYGPELFALGDQRSCGAAVAALPSTTLPVCETPPTGTLFNLLPGQIDYNVNTGTIYLIDTATVDTTTNTLTDVYEIDGFYGAVSAVPEPSAWGLMLGGIAVMGAALRLGRRQRAGLARSPSKPSPQKGRAVVMGLALATAGLAPLSAQAQTAVPGVPNTYTSTSATDSLAFSAPTTQVVTLNAFVTTVIGKLNGGTVYDQVFNVAATSSSVQTALATANSTIFADSGPGVIIDAPILTSSTGSSTTSASTYSVDPVQPVNTITVSTIFGPGPVQLGDQRSCGAAVAALPSTTLPVCATPPAATLFNLKSGQVDINTDTATIYLIDTATLDTTTNTLTDVYEIDGFYGAVSAVPEPSAWALMLGGIAVMGAALRGERRRSALRRARG